MKKNTKKNNASINDLLARKFRAKSRRAFMRAIPYGWRKVVYGELDCITPTSGPFAGLPLERTSRLAELLGWPNHLAGRPLQWDGNGWAPM